MQNPKENAYKTQIEYQLYNMKCIFLFKYFYYHQLFKIIYNIHYLYDVKLCIQHLKHNLNLALKLAFK